MNLKEGTRRLALLLGAAGAIACGFLSYAQLQSTLHQRADHQRFERLADSAVVQQERKMRGEDVQYIKLPDGSYGEFPAYLDDATIVTAIEKTFPKAKPWIIFQALKGRYTVNSNPPQEEHPSLPATLPSGFNGWNITPSIVQQDGIKLIGWNKGYQVAFIETQDGQTLHPTPTPGARSYVLIAILPLLGFFIPWGAVRAIGWVGAGFFQSPN